MTPVTHDTDAMDSSKRRNLRETRREAPLTVSVVTDILLARQSDRETRPQFLPNETETQRH
jgi:hypothetical protein